jgi:23S rRNA (adenine2503-C2)-methyltransferase
MRTITKTHTGNIISDEELKLEYLFVGDYGKENNIKADFLGYTKRIEKVEHRDVDITDKLVVTVSSQKGCPMDCDFCDCPQYGFHGNCSIMELLSEITTAISLSGVKHGKRLNVHFARMGEPTFNEAVLDAAVLVADTIIPGSSVYFDEYHPVISTMMPKGNKNLERFLQMWISEGRIFGGEDGFGLQFSINTLNEEDRNKMFRNKSLSLKEISEIISRLPYPRGRKYTLNFAVTSKSDLNPDIMNELFDKEKCIVKITPIHETHSAVDQGYEIVKDFDVYEKFERPLVEAGWDVIVFIPSEEEDSDRITCGNSLIAKRQQA